LRIAEKSKRKDEVVLLRAFKEWKRMEYQFVLDGLKNYSATLEKRSEFEKNTARAFPMKKTLMW
jgi:hypothetical protein